MNSPVQLLSDVNPSEPSNAADSSRSSILIVDDNIANLAAIEKSLRKLEATIVTVESGKEALALCLRTRFSVILMAVQMHTMDGIETAEALAQNEDTREIPVIFLTAASKDEHHYFKGYQSDTVDYISKPVNPDILAAKVSVFLKLDKQRLEINRMAEELKAVNVRNNLMLNGAAMGILGIDGSGKINFVNPTAQNLLQGSSDLIGLSLLPFLDGKQDFPTDWGRHAIHRSCCEQTELNCTDTVMYDTNGNSFAAEYMFSPVPADTGVSGGVLIFQNVSQRKTAAEELQKSEEKFRGFLENSSDGILILNEKGDITVANSSVEQLTGYQQDDLVGHSMKGLIPARFVRQIMRRWEAYVASTKRLQGVQVGEGLELSILHRDGNEMSVKVRLSSIETGDGLVLCAIIMDRTAENLMNEALRRSQRMDAIGEFTGGVAHDFNNILAIILGNIELLEYEDFNEEKVRARLSVIEKSTQRASQLTSQLLRFSNRKATTSVTTNMNDISSQIDQIVAGTLTPKVTFTHTTCDDLWSTCIDPGDFQDALLNLVINARDAMPNGGQLKLKTANVKLSANYCRQNPDAKPGDYVQLSVTDTGQGISADVMPYIFEPFFSTKEEIKGTGLGLSMVYGFIRRSGGHIKVSTTLGVGTTARLYLPRDRREPEQTALAEPTEATTQEMHRGNETVLLVDDETDLLEVARSSLESLGYRVLTATDGPEAAEQLAAEPLISMLISDVVMPGGISGYQVAALAMSTHPGISVLLTSGYTYEGVNVDDPVHDNIVLLPKPYTKFQLGALVREQLDLASSPAAAAADNASQAS
tara:strand:+ start:94263 stop:96710 length:2448 start_codon:yes stop_codon:yes gene_type:complete